jgi:hypothetical protein
MADLRAHGDQRALVEILRIDRGAIYVREDFELIRHARVIATRRQSIRDDALAYLFLGKGVDHFVFERMVTDRAVTVSHELLV